MAELVALIPLMIPALLIPFLLAAPQHDRPKAFANLSFEEAIPRAKGKFLIVDATAVWCEPCKRMDADTWNNAEVVDWILREAVAIQFDVDRRRDLRNMLAIASMPTVLIYRDGGLFDRREGYLGPKEMLAWLEGVKAGRRYIEQLGEAGKKDVAERYEYAKQLLRAGKREALRVELIWLWNNSIELKPDFAASRRSLLARDIATASRQDPQTRAAFLKILEATMMGVGPGVFRLDVLLDCLTLARVLDEYERVAGWFESLALRPGMQETLAPHEKEVFEALFDHRLHAVAGILLVNPVASCMNKVMPGARAVREGDTPPPLTTASIRDGLWIIDPKRVPQLRKKLARIYAATLAAGRDDAAANVADLLLAFDDTATARMEMVAWSLLAGSPMEVHRMWLEEAAERGADVEPFQLQLMKALGERSGHALQLIKPEKD